VRRSNVQCAVVGSLLAGTFMQVRNEIMDLISGIAAAHDEFSMKRTEVAGLLEQLSQVIEAGNSDFAEPVVEVEDGPDEVCLIS
jgi:hypothetical protein